MLTDPNLIEIVNGQRGMITGIDACIHTQCLVSAVALVYSTIDALSALTRAQTADDTTRSVFIDWVNKYMNLQNLACTAKDLYGARCGILHTYTPDSRLRRDGDAKAIVYKWRNGPDPDPHRLIPLPANAITLIVEDLRTALGAAVAAFLRDIENDTALRAKVERHSQELLCYRPWTAIQISVAA